MSEQPFAGVEVVEFGQFVAVPYAAQLLAEGGAHVIKVEPLEGDPTRHLAPLAPGETRHFLSRNRGKHSLPLDLRNPGSARIIDALLARADVVLLNLRPGLAEELGLDYAALSGRYPRLIVGSVTAFGHRGPDASLAGMDLVVQARSGLMAAQGRMVDGLPGSGDTPISDYMAAVLLALGVSSVLYRRERDGRGGEVDVTLLAAALVLQNNIMQRIDRLDGPVHAERLGRLAEVRAAGRPYDEQLAAAPPSVRTPGLTAVYYRTYSTKDSTVVIACASPSLQKRFVATAGLQTEAEQAAAEGDLASLRAAAEERMRTRTTAEWKAAFDEVGIPASAVYLPIELFNDEQTLANGIIYDMEHPALGTIRTLASPLSVDRTGFRAGPATPAFGSETRAILAAAGLHEDEINDALAAGLTHE